MQQLNNDAYKLLCLLTGLKDDALTLIKDWKNQISKSDYTFENA
jgi:hypothetical protein